MGSLAQLEPAEEHLQLPEHVVVYHPILVLLHVRLGFVQHLEKTVAERRHPVELLKHGDHVAHITQVADAELLLSASDTI